MLNRLLHQICLIQTSDLSVEKGKKTTDATGVGKASNKSSKYGRGDGAWFCCTGEELDASAEREQPHIIITNDQTPRPGAQGSRELTRKTQTSRKLQVNQENMLLWGYSWSASCCLFFSNMVTLLLPLQKQSKFAS